MIDRLYSNGVLTSGEVEHYKSWEFPSVPRLEVGVEQLLARKGIGTNPIERRRRKPSLLRTILRFI